MFKIGIVIIVLSLVISIVLFFKNPFTNLKIIIKNYKSIFKKFSSNLLFIYMPLFIGMGLSFVYRVTEELLIQLIVFLGIIISILFSSSSIMLSRNLVDNENIKKEEYKNVINQTHSVILLEVILCIFLLVLMIIHLALYDSIKNCCYIEIFFNWLIYSFLLTILFNIFIIIKRIFILTEYK